MLPTLAELLTPRIEMVLGKARWEIIFTHRVILSIERETGKSVLKGEISPWTLDSGGLGAMLRITARERGLLGIDLRALSPRSIPRVLGVLQSAWEAAMPLANDENEHSNDQPVHLGDWTEAWANAKICLGLSSDEWLGATPRMIQALSKLALEQVRQSEWMLANGFSRLINGSFARPRDPVQAKDLMLHPWGEIEGMEGGSTYMQSPEDALRAFCRLGSVVPESAKEVMRSLIN